MQKVHIEHITKIDEAACQVIDLIKDNKLICFYGGMGAGKTSLIKAICKQLDVEDFVTSPTFSIVNEYYSPKVGKVYHFDFYRIEDINEAFDIGIEEYFAENCFIFIEWPEIIEIILPENHLKFKIEETKDKIREIYIIP